MSDREGFYKKKSSSCRCNRPHGDRWDPSVFLLPFTQKQGEQKANNQETSALLVSGLLSPEPQRLKIKYHPPPESPFSLWLLTSRTFPYHMLMWAELNGISCKLYKIHLPLKEAIWSCSVKTERGIKTQVNGPAWR